MRFNIEIINETLKIIEDGAYSLTANETRSTARVPLKLSKEQISNAIVLTENEVRSMIDNLNDVQQTNVGRCRFTVSANDSYAAAINISEEEIDPREKPGILVLNFANPVHPGGGVRRGARAQEEDLCRKSTLLASLESANVEAYYTYNYDNKNNFGSDYMIISPTVEIIRDESNNFLEDSVVVSVLTCAAPYLRRGIESVDANELERVIFRRIMGMLHVAVKFGYMHLVLGAWGCGAFGNDAEMIARLFRKAFEEMRCGHDANANGLFIRVEFAVLYNPVYSYNYDCFNKYFGSYEVED